MSSFERSNLSAQPKRFFYTKQQQISQINKKNDNTRQKNAPLRFSHKVVLLVATDQIFQKLELGLDEYLYLPFI